MTVNIKKVERRAARKARHKYRMDAGRADAGWARGGSGMETVQEGDGSEWEREGWGLYGGDDEGAAQGAEKRRHNFLHHDVVSGGRTPGGVAGVWRGKGLGLR